MKSMADLSYITPKPLLSSNYNRDNNYKNNNHKKKVFNPGQSGAMFTTFASKSGGGFPLNLGTSKCDTCRGRRAIDCPGCKGTGKNKKNGNIFERWKCFDCQGFGLKSCPECGKGGLTPEQRGER